MYVSPVGVKVNVPSSEILNALLNDGRIEVPDPDELPDDVLLAELEEDPEELPDEDPLLELPLDDEEPLVDDELLPDVELFKRAATAG